jgi:hypothetical protein
MSPIQSVIATPSKQRADCPFWSLSVLPGAAAVDPGNDVNNGLLIYFKLAATGTSNTARHVADQFGLRPGPEPAGAADVRWALTAPDLADRLVNRRNWGWERFQHWLGTTMADALIGPH